eukprot:CAMPEP_0201988988 /NCGR_PEP_ID=MMETSP0904-20121228/92603_1 /ASSEMBLY_ACC=CAM_ASM_000553 /TAXON_ID=420261 /ORGANISM="Thalassiosira antarctica, Strain CCMP982" /LENGTH=55 /DNA_ID=CAMNT_0048543189 /DNA_START=1323 /DNA_END=1490 /DNA_ORIENTATION=-
MASNGAVASGARIESSPTGMATAWAMGMAVVSVFVGGRFRTCRGLLAGADCPSCE